MSGEANVDIIINPTQPLEVYDQFGVESVTHLNNMGFLDGQKTVARKPVITALDRVFKSNLYVDLPLFEMNDSVLDLCTDVYLSWTVQNASLTDDTCIIPAPYQFDRIELQVSGSTVETYYADHFWFNMRSATKDQIRTYEEIYGFSHNEVPWSESVQNQRRQFELGFGLVDYAVAGVTSEFMAKTATAAGSVIPGLATTTAAVAGLSTYDCQNACFGGFIPRNSSRRYSLRMPNHPLWDGSVNINHNREKIVLRIYPKVGTPLFSEQCKKVYAGALNINVHADSSLISMTQLEAGLIGITLDGSAKQAMNQLSQTKNVHAKSLSPRWQNFEYGTLPSASQQVSTVLTSLEGRFKNLIFFFRENPNDGGENLIQIKKVYNGGNQVTDILPRSTFRLDNVTILNSNGQSVWANQLPHQLLKLDLQLSDYGPRGTVFQSEFEFVEFDWSALQDQGDDKVSRAGGSRVVHNNSKIQYYLPDSAALTTAGVVQGELIMLAYELSEYVQRPDGTLRKRTSPI